MNQQVPNAGEQMPELPHQPAAWPGVLGTFSIIIGSLGVLFNGCCAGMALFGFGPFINWLRTIPARPGAPANQNPSLAADALDAVRPWILVQGLLAVVSCLLAVWLLSAGIGLLRRRKSAVKSHFAWAWARMAVGGVGVAVGLLGALLTAERVASITGTTAQAETIKGVVQSVISLVIVMAYPVVVLAVLSRRWAKEEIGRWGDAREMDDDGLR